MTKNFRTAALVLIALSVVAVSESQAQFGSRARPLSPKAKSNLTAASFYYPNRGTNAATSSQVIVVPTQPTFSTGTTYTVPAGNTNTYIVPLSQPTTAYYVGPPVTTPAPLPTFGYISQHVEGVGFQVMSVNPGSLAAKLGLQPGDMVLALNGHAMTYSAAWNQALYQAMANGGYVQLAIRDARTGTVVQRELQLAPNGNQPQQTGFGGNYGNNVQPVIQIYPRNG